MDSVNKAVKYQYGFAKQHSEKLYNVAEREKKANKIIAVLSDYYHGELGKLSVLDIGCSNGIISNKLSKRFKNVFGVDIDKEALQYAKVNFSSNNLKFEEHDSMNMKFPNNSFDVVICNHIYEHVPDSKRLMEEIYRVLKPNGVCYFSCANRLKLVEVHYNLPFLSLMPKALANLYLKILGKGDYFYENLKTLWGLRKLVLKFKIIDFSLKVINNPEKYCADGLIKSGSLKHRLAILIGKTAYFLLPTYIWILKKE